MCLCFGRFLCLLILAVAPTATRGVDEPTPNQNLVREVRHELLLLPYYSIFDSLSYQVQGSKVVLTGEVIRPSLKSDAESAVKHIQGVSSVENNIQVLPPAPMDDQLRRALFRAIYSEPALSRYAESARPSIHIIVNGGNVVLSGVVDNNADKNIAGIRANGVPNVFSVQNDLRVASSDDLK
jgi:hyperosmotically inducible protein